MSWLSSYSSFQPEEWAAYVSSCHEVIVQLGGCFSKLVTVGESFPGYQRI